MRRDVSERVEISPHRLLPELIREHPETRAVFDRHGLRGCGGRLGPHESVRFFAQVHGVDEASLLAELGRAIVASGSGGRPDAMAAHGVADTIYRRYFLGAIILALTAGASWGAWLLWTIGLDGSFRGVSLHQVNAHGEAQVFGWMGLFIMGFAYQAFPRFWQAELAAPRLAAWVFAAMVTGLVLRTAGMVAAGAWSLALPLALAGGTLQVAAIAAFAGQIVITFERSGARAEPYVGFIMGSLAWFIASGVVSAWHTWNTLTARDPEELVEYVATYQAPLRDLQFHGLALFMILGVASRMLPALYGLPRIADRRAWWALDLLATAVVAEVVLFLAFRRTGAHVLAACLPLAWAMLAAGAAVMIVPWRPWRPFPAGDRSAKFIRAAFAWLGVSLAMLLLLPAYQAASGLDFSHAYYGATRHAITVGFISLMIMGMAARVVPTLAGLAPGSLPGLRGPFLLVNLGCALRVALQVATDWDGRVFPLIGLSGTLEVAGLAWWGTGLARMMLGGGGGEPGEARPEGARPSRIESRHVVADVLAWFPETEPVFERHGFVALRQPMLRRTLARQVTLAQAARLGGVPEQALLDDLNASIAARQSPGVEARLVVITNVGSFQAANPRPGQGGPAPAPAATRHDPRMSTG